MLGLNRINLGKSRNSVLCFRSKSTILYAKNVVHIPLGESVSSNPILRTVFSTIN